MAPWFVGATGALAFSASSVGVFFVLFATFVALGVKVGLEIRKALEARPLSSHVVDAETDKERVAGTADGQSGDEESAAGGEPGDDAADEEVGPEGDPEFGPMADPEAPRPAWADR